ncbi:uncharacterized protein [Arachis hypogaea]|uniref:uncharacterized protein n=1 Tax=Arachis hypogaea TaxID=3818 RepID=UPI003B2175B0
MKRLKKRLDEAKGLWADELGSVIWSYRISAQRSTGVTTFRLTYGLEVVTLVEIGEPIPRRTAKGHDKTTEWDLIDEARSIAYLQELAMKQRVSLRYNQDVIKQDFKKGDLVYKATTSAFPPREKGN